MPLFSEFPFKRLRKKIRQRLKVLKTQSPKADKAPKRVARVCRLKVAVGVFGFKNHRRLLQLGAAAWKLVGSSDRKELGVVGCQKVCGY